jgi:hypothetical protein
VTVAAAFNVNVQVFLLSPPLEQEPDQMASRPFVTLRVALVPDANDAAPLVPVLTLMPAGLDVIMKRVLLPSFGSTNQSLEQRAMDPSGAPELAHPVGPRSMLFTNQLCGSRSF